MGLPLDELAGHEDGGHRVFEIVDDGRCHPPDERKALGAEELLEEIGVGVAQPRGDGADEIHGEAAGRGRQRTIERGGIERAEEAGLLRGGGGGARRPVNERHLAEELARAERGEGFLPALATGDGNLHGAGEHEIQAFAGLACPEDHLASRNEDGAHGPRGRLDNLRRDALEKPVRGHGGPERGGGGLGGHGGETDVRSER